VQNMGHRIKKLNSVRHRNMILKVAHGDVYTLERKLRYGMTLNGKCQCGETEDLIHKFWECKRIRHLWKTINIGEIDQGNELKNALGASLSISIQDMTKIAELLCLINSGTITDSLWKFKLEKMDTSQAPLHENEIPEERRTRGSPSP